MTAPTVIGSWELGYSAPLTESYLWAWPLREFEVTDWRMWPISGIRCPEQRVTLTEYPTINDALEGVKSRIFLEPRNTSYPFPSESIWLPDFEHPEEAVYVFGSNHFNPTIARVRPEDVVVTMPTVENSGVLWSHQVMVSVLYDRMVKSWR